MPARPDADEFAFAREISLAADPFGELRRAIEDELFVAEAVEHKDHIVGGGKARRLEAGAVEVLMAHVQRNREKTLRSPFETVLAAVFRRHHGRAMARDHIDHFFADVPQRG
jgi:hypothetical protein